MKAIIPVAGAGVMLRPYTHNQPKPLIPVAGKPILAHIIENLLAAGVQDFVFVVGHLADKIKQFIEEHYTNTFKYEFILQEKRLGVAHAVWLCKDLFPSNNLIIALGDTIIDDDLAHFVSQEGSIVAVHVVEDPRRFGIVFTNPEGIVLSYSEKSRIPKSNLALVGLYKLFETDKLQEALEKQLSKPLENGGDYNLTDTLAIMSENQVKIRAMQIKGWYDCGQKDQLLFANRVLLNRMGYTVANDFVNTVIIPPVSIAKACEIQNAVIGPNVVIGEHSHIKDTIIQDAIIGNYTRLESIVVKQSIIGNDSIIKGRQYSVNIGDNTEIDFNS